jgi:lipoprotein-releasing system permease protein
MIMMIVSVATGIGLQQKNQKFPSMGISLFLIMIIISPKFSSLPKKQDPKFDVVEGVSHIQAIASKAGIRTENAFEGIILKVWGEIISGTT